MPAIPAGAASRLPPAVTLKLILPKATPIPQKQFPTPTPTPIPMTTPDLRFNGDGAEHTVPILMEPILPAQENDGFTSSAVVGIVFAVISIALILAAMCWRYRNRQWMPRAGVSPNKTKLPRPAPGSPVHDSYQLPVVQRPNPQEDIERLTDAFFGSTATARSKQSTVVATPEAIDISLPTSWALKTPPSAYEDPRASSVDLPMADFLLPPRASIVPVGPRVYNERSSSIQPSRRSLIHPTIQPNMRHHKPVTAQPPQTKPKRGHTKTPRRNSGDILLRQLFDAGMFGPPARISASSSNSTGTEASLSRYLDE
ncbi:uncharacterized protein EV422DRAFT_208354 [Fimicolochytrium jonesii]|uniref:uncharacterized protein n=1 Tax=Fimicolochytrium jonesii TaxID=1396493 RepID=UPI0022FE51BC|nr:uncharacterized protein EV422DRAFT_208354 [Fimicolochytrium jonesii]KAI8817848.1 hypothetical protein EV422DRAFT_208354 [Fimicolochytrium jonesii]